MILSPSRGARAFLYSCLREQLLEAIIGNEAFVDIALGGGRRNFLDSTMVDSEGSIGRRGDGRSLMEEAASAGVIAVESRVRASSPSSSTSELADSRRPKHAVYKL